MKNQFASPSRQHPAARRFIWKKTQKMDFEHASPGRQHPAARRFLEILQKHEHFKQKLM